MKQKLLSLLLLFMGSAVFAQNTTRDISTIDAGDTVFFNMAQLATAGAYADFPVFIRSDDVINSLDFSFKYSNCYVIDTITKLYNNLSMTYNVTADTTLYLTSFNLQPIPNDTPLVKIRFHLLGGQPLCKSDIYSIASYLNGDICTSFTREAPGCSVGGQPCYLGMNQIESEFSSISFYPNPVSNSTELKFFSNSNKNTSFSICDLMGRMLMNENFQSVVGNNHLNLDLSNLAPGIYILTLVSDSGRESARLIKE